MNKRTLLTISVILFVLFSIMCGYFIYKDWPTSPKIQYIEDDAATVSLK